MKDELASVLDLYEEQGKTELVEGKIAHLPMNGFLPSYASGEILVALASLPNPLAVKR
jgi:hypothetical protein